MVKFKIYPTKARFNPKEKVELKFVAESFPHKLKLKVNHISEPVFETELTIEDIETIITLPNLPENQSYGVECDIDGQIIATAFETYDTWERVPRYGFLSEFATKDLGNDDYMETLLRLHINVVQYYDWMYRHNNLIAPESEFTDLMGRHLNQDVVREKIALCKQNNIANIAYGAIYGASNAFYEKHKEWAFFNSQKQPIRFIDVFTIMNFTHSSPWRNHIINQYRKAIEIMGFDGIHIDTYGYPKVARDYLGYVIRLDDHFAKFIADTKKALTQEGLPSQLIFNNVGGWPIDKTYYTPQSALYIEIWDPITSYENVASLIRRVHSLTREKELIISAYLKPYYEKDKTKAISAHKYLYAIISALGAHHLIMGEDKKALRTGYYCDHASLTDPEFEEIRKYYDFNTEFSEILYEKTLDDVSLTHTFGDNIEYVLEDKRFSVHADAGSIYGVIKENESRQVINLINLTTLKNSDWNKQKPKPQEISALEMRILMIDDVEEILLVSPDQKSSRLKYQIKPTDRGNQITFTIPKLYYWDMIIINKRTDSKDET